MAGFEIPGSLRAYFDDKELSRAVDALTEVLQGDEPPVMKWSDAKAYNRALLMAAQVRADHNDMLFDLWDRVFGAAVNIPRRSFEVDFEANHCTPHRMFQDSFVWRTMSREGLDDEDLEETYELTIEHDKRIIFLSVSKWDATEDEYVDFKFSPSKIPGGHWKQHKDDDDVKSARSAPITISDFLDDPELHIADMQQAAQAMVAYLAKII